MAQVFSHKTIAISRVLMESSKHINAREAEQALARFCSITPKSDK